jgi:RHS repeat-associated protein
VNYTYDLDGRLTQVTDGTGTYSFTFDNMGRLIGTTSSYSFLSGRNFRTSYSYDKASNRIGFTDPEGGSTTYVYDTLNRLQTLTPPSVFTTGSFGFSYDALSRRTQITRPNNVTTDYTYDNLSRLLSVLHQLSGNNIDGTTYTVDNAGNRTAKTDQHAGVTSNYGYDAIYEVTSVTQATNTTESYTYDPVGNRLSSLGISPYTFNTSNELISTPNATYTYDNNGDTTSRTDSGGSTNYTWDFENRLTSITLPGNPGTVSFKYDPLGRRIYKSSSSATSIYAYDGDNLIEETNSAGSVVARYAQTQYVDEPLAMLRSGATSYFETDGSGSTTSLSNASGTLAQTYTFDSFGKTTNSSGSLTNPFQYTSRELDGETNLYYFRARYFDPNVGRFISEDPLSWSVGTNYYSYVQNSPLNLLDPSGLGPCKIDAKCRGNRTTPLRIIRIGTLGIVNFKHCYIGVTDSNGDTFILSAGPNGDMHTMGSWVTPLKDSDEKNNFNKDKDLKLKCSNGDDPCHQVDCMKNVAAGYGNNFPVYDFRGQKAPNSNSFTNQVT